MTYTTLREVSSGCGNSNCIYHPARLRFRLTAPIKCRSTTISSLHRQLEKEIHVPRMSVISARRKDGAVLIFDRGPDWNDLSWTVAVYLSRFLRRVDLESLCLTKYAPKSSALNPIEHGWAPLIKMITSVRLRSTLQLEDLKTRHKRIPINLSAKNLQICQFQLPFHCTFMTLQANYYKVQF